MSDRADVDEGLGVDERVDEVTFFGRYEIQALGEHSGDVGVSLKAEAFDQREDPLHLPLVVDVLGEDVFIERIPCRAVDEHQSWFAVDTGEFTEEFPAFFVSESVAGLEHLAGPEDGPFGSGIESFGIEQCPLVVVAQQAHGAPGHAVDALTRVGSVADDITQAIDLLDRLRLDVFEHRLESFEVAVDVADQGSAHERNSTGRGPLEHW